MTAFTRSPSPILPATTLFGRLAPRMAEELAGQLHRRGLHDSEDLIWALLTGLKQFAREQGVCLATDFPAAWPEALSHLRDARGEDDWERLLRQSATAPRATGHQIALGASQMARILAGFVETTGMSPRVAAALGTWVLVAVVIAHSGPRDADLTLEELAGCL